MAAYAGAPLSLLVAEAAQTEQTIWRDTWQYHRYYVSIIIGQDSPQIITTNLENSNAVHLPYRYKILRCISCER